MKNFFVVLFCFSICVLEGALNPRKVPAHLTSSVLVPCVASHFKLLHPLLEYYANQTVLPDEIVISLSETSQLDPALISSLENHPWPYRLKIIRHPLRKLAGMNRTSAAHHASGDIFICQDADDIPHPQRVEITKFVFENYFVNHMLHQWSCEGEPFIEYDVSNLSISSYDNYEQCACNQYVTNGNICISRNLALSLPWPETIQGEDVTFNKLAYKLFENKVVVRCALIEYRMGLSAYGDYARRKAR